ncbi:MAG: hypothetical protein JWP27_2846 [Flaviaesturariibacter sp.]|nr:hypothetical protein [Flaviaesturariibacter sp.]
MKIPVLAAFAAFLLCTGCNKAVDAIAEKVLAPSAPATTDGFVRYTIQSGNQYADGNTYKAVSVSEQAFLVRFDSSAVYTTHAAENQYDINKLYGFSDNNAAHHEFSARFGWRWSDGALRLFAYVYNNGASASQEITSVPIGKDVACSIRVAGAAYVFKAGDATVTMPRASTTALGAGYQLYPYFGGDESAPHAVSIWIKALSQP